MFLLKKAYFHLSFLNYINCFLIKETTALSIMKGDYLCEDLYKLKGSILRCPGYSHCWESALSILGKCRKCFYMLLRGVAVWRSEGVLFRRMAEVKISYSEKCCR